VLGSQPPGAPVQEVDEHVQRLPEIWCDFRPLMSTTKPTPHASCSWRGIVQTLSGRWSELAWHHHGHSLHLVNSCTIVLAE